MRETDQTIFEKGKGNCFAACIASLLGLPVTEVAYFPAGNCPNWRDIINDWLAERGFFFLDVSMEKSMHDSLARYWGHHIIMGESPRSSGEWHAVVGYKGDMVFDPHPSRAGLSKDTERTYGFLIGR